MLCVSDVSDMVRNDYCSFLFKGVLSLLFPHSRDTINIKLVEEGDLQLLVQKSCFFCKGMLQDVWYIHFHIESRVSQQLRMGENT